VGGWGCERGRASQATRAGRCGARFLHTQLLGWNMVDLNLTTGGLLGYSSLNCIVRRKVPVGGGFGGGEGRGEGWCVSDRAAAPISGARRADAFRLTSVPWRVLRAEDDGVPHHDVVRARRAVDALRRVRLQALEVAHQALWWCFGEGGWGRGRQQAVRAQGLAPERALWERDREGESVTTQGLTLRAGVDMARCFLALSCPLFFSSNKVGGRAPREAERRREGEGVGTWKRVCV
jgi:hypothetical protein